MGTQDLLQERIAENQSIFREANERIEAAAAHMGLHGRIPFICECAGTGCAEIVRLTLDEYERARQHPRRFFTAVGREDTSVDTGAGEVVEELDEYVIVDKIGLAGEIAAERHEDVL